jgi:UMF1 family MFS transporter
LSSERPDLGVFSWCLYDWANSAFSTVITTFVFATYFTQAVAPDPLLGTILWGQTLSLAAFMVAVVSPVLGAIADKRGRRKPWLLACTLLCAIATSLMWFVKPSSDYVRPALLLLLLASVAFSFGMVFYNAMLPTLVPAHWRGRVSGWGWGLGYLGGLACLFLVLILAQGGTSWTALDEEKVEPQRIAAVMVGLWFVVFSLPLFLFTPDRPATGMSLTRATRDGLRTLWDTLRAARRHAAIVRFLLAHLCYTNGLTTLFAFGAIYAAGTFRMDFAEVLRFGIALNVSAGFGAMVFAWVDDWIGSKRTILIALLGLTLFGGSLVLVQSKEMLWVFGVALGIFVGPAQAAGRSLMARLAPPEQETEMFGLYALAGKSTAFLGPLILAFATDVFASQRAGMATILVFFIAGMALLRGVREPKA